MNFIQGRLGGDYETALALVIDSANASPSFVQRHLGIGYNLALSYVEQMEAAGLVTSPDAVGKRRVLAGGN